MVKSLVNLPVEGFQPLVQLTGKIVYFFRYDAVPVLDEDGKDTGTANYTEVRIVMRNAIYESMVTKCIESKYSQDSQIALLYNYQKDPDTYQSEMDTYQEWRTYCKTACKGVFNMSEEAE